MSNQNVINLDLLEPEAIKQLHGNLGRQLEAMGQARVSTRNLGYSENHEIWYVNSSGPLIRKIKLIIWKRKIGTKWTKIRTADTLGQARYNMTKIAEIYLDSKLTLEQVKDTKEEGDFDLLVPMTSMLYVRGQLIKTGTTLIDLGQDILIEKK